MRWTDLPADNGPPDAATLSRGEWEDLRRRLERLPPGHPSRADREAEAAPEDGRAEPGPDDAATAGRRRAGAADGRQRDAGRAGGATPGGHGELAGPRHAEPYRPWFTAGGPPEPWFAAGPDAAEPG
jgi:hypothetical protein